MTDVPKAGHKKPFKGLTGALPWLQIWVKYGVVVCGVLVLLEAGYLFVRQQTLVVPQEHLVESDTSAKSTQLTLQVQLRLCLPSESTTKTESFAFGEISPTHSLVALRSCFMSQTYHCTRRKETLQSWRFLVLFSETLKIMDR